MTSIKTTPYQELIDALKLLDCQEFNRTDDDICIRERSAFVKEQIRQELERRVAILSNEEALKRELQHLQDEVFECIQLRVHYRVEKKFHWRDRSLVHWFLKGRVTINTEREETFWEDKPCHLYWDLEQDFCKRYGLNHSLAEVTNHVKKLKELQDNSASLEKAVEFP